ncbi:hypothetical protein NDU88_005048 [Pleurodeles waltl]|uniref:Uncharacterized protein n=1 Tax=Pleurodeles waltl TaxID=8319 RepID=A0AAV7WW12_PLEWA|nr:hypothetical protein NDU88_005048 [Pleurodeles waltl]
MCFNTKFTASKWPPRSYVTYKEVLSFDGVLFTNASAVFKNARVRIAFATIKSGYTQVGLNARTGCPYKSACVTLARQRNLEADY